VEMEKCKNAISAWNKELAVIKYYTAGDFPLIEINLINKIEYVWVCVLPH
jgi:hypothetical protein